jgi:hypothetical protein|nr:MAG TPA: hypothetical protein [Caudoviricetes sp.]
MAINYMEIKPSEHAVKDIRGWVDSRTGEVLVAAYGYFTGDALKQQGQGVVFTAYDGKFDPLYLKAPSNFRSLKFGKVDVGEGLTAEIKLEDIETEQYTITIAGDTEVTESRDVAATVRRKEWDKGVDKVDVEETLLFTVNGVVHQVPVAFTITLQ